jgi:hypothetical protein
MMAIKWRCSEVGESTISVRGINTLIDAFVVVVEGLVIVF